MIKNKSPLTLCDPDTEYSDHLHFLSNILKYLSWSASTVLLDENDGDKQHGLFLLLNSVADEIDSLSDRGQERK